MVQCNLYKIKCGTSMLPATWLTFFNWFRTTEATLYFCAKNIVWVWNRFRIQILFDFPVGFYLLFFLYLYFFTLYINSIICVKIDNVDIPKKRGRKPRNTAAAKQTKRAPNNSKSNILSGKCFYFFFLCFFLYVVSCFALYKTENQGNCLFLFYFFLLINTMTIR